MGGQRKVRNRDFTTMTPEERMAKETTEKSYAMFEQKFNEQQERLRKQTQIDREDQVAGAMNLDARVQNKVAEYDSVKSLEQAANLATMQTKIQAAGNNLEQRDQAQRNLAFLKNQYESDLIQSGGQVKTAQQEANKSLTSAVADDSIAEAKAGLGRSFISGLVSGAAKNSGTSYDTNKGYYYDEAGNPLTQGQYTDAYVNERPVYQQEQKRFFGFNTGDPIYSAVNPLANLPRLENPIEITEKGDSTSPTPPPSS